MADLDAALAANRAAAEQFLAATDRLGAAWSTTPAPGKWSPAQITEHLAVCHEVSAHVALGGASDFPKPPRLLRPLIRALAFNSVLKKGRFARPVRTFKSLEPVHPPASPAEGRARLEAAVRKYEADLMAWAGGKDRAMDHPAFGTIALADYVRFNEIHTRHHQKQLPGG